MGAPEAEQKAPEPLAAVPVADAQAVVPAEDAKVAQQTTPAQREDPGFVWLSICFLGIMGSFIIYGMVLEYATSGGRKLHELSYIFVTSSIYSLTAYVGRVVRHEEPTTVPTHKLLILAMTSMGSTFTSVRSLRYVIFPVQVLAKSCKPIPVMIMGAFLGKKYPLKKYVNVAVITMGVAMFMGGGDGKGSGEDADKQGAMMWFGVLLLFISLCFDGGTGAYEDKLMHKDHIGPFELMYNIQLGKTILAFIGLMALNEVNYFFQMCYETGPILFLLGVTGAMGQIFIFVTINKFGALTCALIGLARKITTLVVSIIFFGHRLNLIQTMGLMVSIIAMVYNFLGKTSSDPTPAQVEEQKKTHLEISDQKLGSSQEKQGLLAGGDGMGAAAAAEEEDPEADAFPDAKPEEQADIEMQAARKKNQPRGGGGKKKKGKAQRQQEAV